MNAIELFLAYPFLQRALLAALVVALLCGVLGVYVVLRGMSLLGDGLAHLSLAGVALGLVLGVYPLGLALVFAIAGALVIQALRSRGLVRGDTAIGILFTAGLAFGILVISRNRGTGIDLATYLFGNLLTVTPTDLALIGGLAIAFVAVFLALQKELLYVTFSEEAARLSGLPVRALDVAFTVLTAASIVVASRIVGILLVSALLVVPAATALLLARSFRGALLLAVGFGTVAVLAGVFAAAQWGTPTGASVALASAGLFGVVVSIRGLVGAS